MLVIKCTTICVLAVLVLIEPTIQANIDAAASGVWTSSSSRIGGKVANESDGPTNSTLNNRPVKQIIIPQEVIRVPNSQWSTRKRIGQFFTEWSPWTSCDSQCRQRRERYCKVLRKCSDTKHVEERQCFSNYICKERAGGGGGSHHPTTGGQHRQQTNNNMSAGHNVLESYSVDRSAVSKFDGILNKFNPKWQRDQMDDSEFHIIKINHKKRTADPPEMRANNKLELARPIRTVQIILGSNKINNTKTLSTFDESDGWTTSLFGGDNNELLEGQTTTTTTTDEYEDNLTDYQADDESRLMGKTAKHKNGQPIKKYAPIVTADPKGTTYRVYGRWSKWSKCSAKCTTRRFKRCRMKEVCANEVLREVAYCYTENSFCEDWIVRQMYVPRAPPPPSSMNTQNQYPVEQPANNRQVANTFQERKLPPRLTSSSSPVTPGQCGVATAVSNRRKPASHMLRIIGGRVVRKGSYPWQVAILNRFKEAFCGGTLISKQWILTAAHCVRKRLYVRLGEHNLEERDGTEVEYRVEYAIRHPSYDKTTVDNDIALLRLPKEIIPSAYIGFACLPHKNQRLPIGTKCTIIGWGKRKNADDAGTKYLHEAQVPIVQNEDCKEVYDDYTITKNMFCAGHKRGRIDTCSGDSGGPLLCKDPSTAHWSILGVTSFGDGCGKRNKFGIYTKVSNYVDWIQSVVECSGNCRRF